MKSHRLFAALLIGLLLLSACHKETEQDKVKKVITSIQKAAGKRDLKEILSRVSKDYRDPQGNNYAATKDILILYFFRNQKISVTITDLEADVSDSSAKATFQAILAGRSDQSAGDLLPETLGAYRFEVGLNKEANEWKVISAKWERFEN
jgi:ketosteroid isomerase-like protein